MRGVCKDSGQVVYSTCLRTVPSSIIYHWPNGVDALWLGR